MRLLLLVLRVFLGLCPVSSSDLEPGNDASLVHAKKLRERKQRKIPFRVRNVRFRHLQASEFLLYEPVVGRDFSLLSTTARLGYT